MLALFSKLNGWKTILGYLVAMVAGSQPLLGAAFAAWMANKQDPQAITNLLAQLAVAGGLFHKFIKNVNAIGAGKSPA